MTGMANHGEDRYVAPNVGDGWDVLRGKFHDTTSGCRSEASVNDMH